MDNVNRKVINMRIDITPKTTEIEIPNYGKYQITPLGAGAEAEIRVSVREFNEAYEDAKQYQDLVDKERSGEKMDRTSDEYQEGLEAFNKVALLADKSREITLEKMRRCFKGDPEAIENLFNDFTYQQIQEIYNQAIGDKDGGLL